MKEKKIDWIITLVPLAIIVALCILFLHYLSSQMPYSVR